VTPKFLLWLSGLRMLHTLPSVFVTARVGLYITFLPVFDEIFLLSGYGTKMCIKSLQIVH
jgi:hypothetical protein